METLVGREGKRCGLGRMFAIGVKGVRKKHMNARSIEEERKCRTEHVSSCFNIVFVEQEEIDTKHTTQSVLFDVTTCQAFCSRE